MILTGKAKELFYDWLGDWFETNASLLEETYYTDDLDNFCNLPLSMQWGVYIEFSDSLGYYISTDFSTNYELTPNGWFDWYITDGKKLDEWGECKTRKEAQTAALEKLNELINNEK